MDRIKFIAVGIFGLLIHAYVRLSRAVDAALWELCPGVVKWCRSVHDLAHKAVCAEQRVERKERETTSSPSQLSDRFTSIEAWDAACKAYEQKADFLREERSREQYGTPGYAALTKALEENGAKWRATIARQPSIAVYSESGRRKRAVLVN